MPWSYPGAAALVLALAACGDPARSSADAGLASDAGVVSLTCDEAPVSAEIGPAGGSLALCGGSLTVPPGALAAPMRFGIAPAATPPAPAAPRTLAGPALRFTPDGAALPAQVELAVPHTAGDARFEMFAVESGELVGVEPCVVDQTTLRQTVGRLGTFVATRDDYPYPASSAHLGAGSVSSHIGDADESWSIPDDGTAFDQDYGDGIGLTVTVSRLAPTFEELAFDAWIAPGGGQAGLVDLHWAAGDPLREWQLGTAAAPGTAGVLTIDAVDGARVRGSLSATVFDGADTLAVSARFDATTTYYAYPIERVCADR